MEWFYAVGDKQMGPVNDEEFKKLAAEGTIRPDTLVWRAGMDNWKPYREVTAAAAGPGQPVSSMTVPAAGSPSAAPGTDTVVCRECGQIFPVEEVVKFGDAFVCENCKPIYVQRMREGVSTGGFGATVSEDELLNRDYEVEIGEALSQGWEIFKRNAGILIGASVVVYLILIGISLIPFIGGLIQWLINGPMLGGLWLVFIKCIRDEETRMGDAFTGFGPKFSSLFATSVISSLLIGVCMIPVAIVAVIFFVIPMQMASQSATSPNFSTAGIVAIVVTGIPAFLAMMYLNIAWFFALPLVSDKGLGFWAAMNLSRKAVNKHFWGTLLFFIVCWLLMMVSLLACGVGILVGGPLAACAITWHYQRVFGDLAPDIE